MLTPSDLISLPYTPDLTGAGIAYACRSLPHTYNRMGGSLQARLRRIVAGKALELAFRRYLGAENIPYDILGATPFTDPDRYDVSLGGRRCDLKSFQITQKEKIRLIRQDSGQLLQASALVPVDQLASESLTETDIYLFAFVAALIAVDGVVFQKALAAGQPFYLIHPLPESWARPKQWSSLGSLVFKCESSQEAIIEVGGQGQDRRFITEQLVLLPKQRMRASQDFFSLAYIHIHHLPRGRLGLHSDKKNNTYLIEAHQWSNIWVYGLDIILAGYMTRGEFRQRSRYLPAASPVFQYEQTRTKNYALPIHELHVLADLFQKTKEWKASKLAAG